MKVTSGTLWEATNPVGCWHKQSDNAYRYGGWLASGSLVFVLQTDGTEDVEVLTERGVLFVDAPDFRIGFKPVKQLNTKKR